MVGLMVNQDDMLVVKHVETTGRSFLGHLVIETRRHAAYLYGLTDAEAVAVGRAARAAAVALRAELDPLFVHSAVAGVGHEHFHQHVFVRHRGTPESLAWHDADEWDDAPRGDRADLEALCARLRRSGPW